MYFDFEDYHPDISPVGRAISWREGVLLSIIVHLVMVILILVAPKWFPWLTEPRRVQVVARQAQQEPPLQFVMVAPRVERPVPKPPERALPSDLDRAAASPERAQKPENMRAVLARQHARARRRAAAPGGARAGAAAGSGRRPADREPAAGSDAENARVAVGAADAVQPRCRRRTARTGAPRRRADRSATRCATCSATRRTRRSTTRAAAAQFGPEIQFDTKGVEFGPWIRRFIAQVKRNWFIPYAAMSMKGHVVDHVQRAQGRIDHRPAGRRRQRRSTRSTTPRSARCPARIPTQPLPPEYPDDKAFFTVTFFYNETPPR